jgi:hypothetical protein
MADVIPTNVGSTMGSVYSTESVYPVSDRFKGKSRASRKEIEKAVSWAKETFTSIKSARLQFERMWMRNLCFYGGRQYVTFRNTSNIVQSTMGSLTIPPAPYWRARPVINRIRPIIRTELSKLTAQKPSAFIVPNSSDDNDLFAAQAGEQIWESIYRRKKLRKIIRKAVWWQAICGTAFIKSSWDPTAVDPDSDQLGDFHFCHETPFHIFVPDFREEELEYQPYLIHAQLRTHDWIQVRFPELKLNTGDKTEEILPNSFLNLIGANNVRGQTCALVYECWIKPNALPQFPNGAMFTVIGDHVVQSVEGWPYIHNQYPFAKLEHIPNGTFYSESTIVDLTPLQKEYNRTRGQIIENKNRMSKIQLLAEKGSVDASMITSEPGQVIFYQPGYEKPSPMPLVSLPNYVTQELDRILSDMEDISGQHEVSNGKAPPGVTAATAINYLQEQDDSKLAPTYEALEEAIEKVAFQSLSYVTQFWDAPRTIKVVGNDNSFDALTFLGSDLRGNTDIRVEAGSSLPTSKAAKQAFIMDLMKFGFLDPAKGLEVMEIGGIQKIYEEVQLDVRQAQRENLRMASVTDEEYDMHIQNQMLMQQNIGGEVDPATGMPMPPSYESVVPTHTWDNHQIHIETHNKYRKSQAFDQLSEGAKQAFEQHVNEHRAAFINDMMEQLANQHNVDDAESASEVGAEETNPDTVEPPVAEG